MVELLEAWCFKGAENFISLFFCFWFVLFEGLGELVSMMECNHGYSMDTLYELCESRLCEWTGAELSREQGDEGKLN
jgi:hypothetical protein